MLKMNIADNKLVKEDILDEIIREFSGNLTWMVLEMDLRNNPNHEEHSERLRKIEEKINRAGYKMHLYEDKNRKGLYHLHFVKKVGELEYA